MASSPLLNQITNRNFLLPSAFKFVLSQNRKIDFFCSEINIPRINLGVAIQPTYLKDIPIPGDKLTYDDLSLRFIVDENMENYAALHNWLRGLGYPESVYEYQELLNQDKINPGKQTAFSGQSDGELIIYNSSFNPVSKVVFKGLFPTSLSAISFNSQMNGAEYIVADVSFKYIIYEIIPIIQSQQEIATYKKPTIEFTASSLIIEGGQSSTISWIVKNAYSASINVDYGNNIGMVSLTGSTGVSPDQSVTYTLTAKGKGGISTKSLSISVIPTSATRTCIAVIDENSETSASTMEILWNQFRQNWPNRRFYLLQPGSYGNSVEGLAIPISFLEETEASSASIP